LNGTKKSVLQLRAEFALAWLLLNGIRWLPKPLADRVGDLAARLLDRLVPKLRRVASLNLFFAFPEATDEQRKAIIDGVFRSLGRLVVAMGKMPNLNADNISEWVGYDGLENYAEAKQAGKGILVATAHLGNWELSAFAHALLTEPMDVMVRPLDNPLIDRLVEDRRTQSGNKLIYKKDGARAVLKALRNNEAVGMLIDQNTTATEGVFVDFFGRRACAGTGFVKLAQHSGAAVIPGFAFWDKTSRRYTIHFYPKVPLTGDIAADTQRIHSIFEDIIRQHPDQWMWIHRRWKTRPEGEAPIY
jgi:Kdo2-lipid IVA lauroyltransferase/acyltransferase